MDFVITTDLDIDSMSSELGFWLWHIAIAFAPIDTGNLRRAITMNSNTDTRKLFVYNAFNAIYLHYLEEGMGSVKKYKDFIKTDTMMAFIQEVMYYFKTGMTGLLTGKPYINLKESQQGAMFYEKKLMKALNINQKTLTADDRMMLSQLRYRGLVGSNKERVGGMKPTAKYSYSRKNNLSTDYFFVDTKDYDGSAGRALTIR